MNPQIPTPAPTRTPIDRIPFLRLLGLQQEPAPPGHCNLLPAAHGVVIMTLPDAAMARAATSAPGAASRGVVTVEMSSRLVTPGRGPLVASGRVLHRGASLCTCQADVHQSDGTLVASAMGTFKSWKAPLRGIE